MRRLKLVCVNLTLALGMFSLTFQVRAEELIIPGSGNPEVVLRAMAEAFARHQTAHKVVIPPTTGTAGALRDVSAGTAVLGRVGRQLRPDEVAKGLTYIPLGRDPVAFVAGAGVKITGLSLAQVLDAYTGRVSNWKELGGNALPIRAVGREQGDASRQAINRAVKPFESIVFGDSVKVVNLDPQMLDLLDRYPSSLGFLNRSALTVTKTKVTLLALDGVEPTQPNVATGRYPIWLEFGLVHKTGALSPAARAFIEFTRSSEGLRVLRDNGILAAAVQR